MTSYGNVLFLAVARIADQGIVVASCSYHTETDLNAVQHVLEQPNLNMSVGKHYSFSVGQLGWHLIADELRLVYIVICQKSYPQRCAHMCLEELQRNFAANYGDKAITAKARALDKPCNGLLLKICQKYDNLVDVDKLASVAKKVDSVKLVMQENVDLALQNCVKLETIEMQSEELQQAANVFKRSATELKNKLWWKNFWTKLAVGFIILVILAIIIGVPVALTTKK